MTGNVIQPDAFKKHHEDLVDEEQGWINQLKQGQQTALKPLYDKYGQRVFALSYRLSGDSEIAEDICQEVFVQVWQKIINFNGESKFSTWLHSVTSHIAINHMRKQKRWWQSWFIDKDSKSGDAMIESIAIEDDQTDFSLSRNGLDKHILMLPEQARVVFVLFAIEGWRHDEIAEELKIAVGSSKSQFHRAKKLLQESLAQEEQVSGVIAS